MALNVLTVVDWPEPGPWIWGDLPAHDDHYTIVSLSGVRFARSSIERSTIVPLRYLWAGSRVLPRLSGYDVVFSWEVKCGLPIALYQTLTGRRHPRHVILGLIYKSVVARFPAAGRWIFSSLAGAVCFTRVERDICCANLGLPPEHVHFMPLVWDVKEDEESSPDEWDDYILSVGSSNRDYRTLFQAAERVRRHFIVVARPYNVAGLAIPPNVELRLDLPSAEVTRLLRHARLVVVPLCDTVYAAGQGVVLRAMSAARAVIVTRTPGIEDYVRHGETGLFVSPYNVEEMAAEIGHLLNSPETTRQIGQCARQEAVAQYSFAVLARRLSNLAQRLVIDGAPSAESGTGGR